MQIRMGKQLLLLGFVLALVVWVSIQGAVVYADHDDGYESHGEYDNERIWDEHYADEHFREESDDDDDRNYNRPPLETKAQTQGTMKDGQTVNIYSPDNNSIAQINVAVRQGEPLIPANPALDVLNVPYVGYSNGTLLEMYANKHHVIFHTDKQVVYIDGSLKTVSTAPFMLDGQYYIPLNVLTEVLGDKEEWNPEIDTLLMRKGG